MVEEGRGGSGDQNFRVRGTWCVVFSDAGSASSDAFLHRRKPRTTYHARSLLGLRPSHCGAYWILSSDAMSPESPCRADRPCLGGSKSRDRLSGETQMAGRFFWGGIMPSLHNGLRDRRPGHNADRRYLKGAIWSMWGVG